MKKTKMTEYIEKEKVLDILRGNWCAFSDPNVAMRNAIDKIKDYPAETFQSRQHGRWTEGKVVVCSVCGCGQVDAGAKRNYCPNCGARMDG